MKLLLEGGRTGLQSAALEAVAAAMEHDDSVTLITTRADAAAEAELPSCSFPKGRVRRVPPDATALGALCVGAAMAGLRPVLDLTHALVPHDSLRHLELLAAGLHYRTGGRLSCPVVCCVDAVKSPEFAFSPLAFTPGLKVVVPSTAHDAAILMTEAIQDPDPVVYILDGPGGEADSHLGTGAVHLGQADIKREGTDVTVVATGSTVAMALAVAADLEGEGVRAEVIDMHTLAPLDIDRVLNSVSATGRLVVCEDATGVCSVANEIAATVTSVALPLLKAAPRRVTREHMPLPCAPALRDRVRVSQEDIRIAVRSVLGSYGP